MRKIGEIKGVPVVEGNVNEVTKNQIHYKEEEGGIQLSKRNNENKLNSITGSSEGGGDKLYYYTWNTDQYDAQISFIADILSPIKINDVIIGSNYAFHRVDKFFINGKPDDIYNRHFDAFCISSKSYIIYDGVNIDYKIYNVPEGDLITKLYSIMGGDYSMEQLASELNYYVKEITKEEYESMITYKPEL